MHRPSHWVTSRGGGVGGVAKKRSITGFVAIAVLKVRSRDEVIKSPFSRCLRRTWLALFYAERAADHITISG